MCFYMLPLNALGTSFDNSSDWEEYDEFVKDRHNCHVKMISDWLQVFGIWAARKSIFFNFLQGRAGWCLDHPQGSYPLHRDTYGSTKTLGYYRYQNKARLSNLSVSSLWRQNVPNDCDNGSQETLSTLLDKFLLLGMPIKL